MICITRGMHSTKPKADTYANGGGDMGKSPRPLPLMITCAAILLLLAPGCDWIKARFYIFHMESGERVGKLNVEKIARYLGISPGTVIADIGACSGLFTFPLARITGRGGTVYAVDINRDLLDHISGTKRPEGCGTVKTVLASEDDPKLPVPVDLVFFCDTLHYVSDQPRYLARLASYVKPGGRIAIIDFTQNWPPRSNRFTTKDLTAWMAAAGFTVSEKYDFIQDEFFFVFTRK
jgi:arsenite methyltransferase